MGSHGLYVFSLCKRFFLEEYKSQIKKEEGMLRLTAMRRCIIGRIPVQGDPYNVKTEGHPLNYDRVFIDEEGLKWAYVNYYYMGWHSFWICVDDPSNLNLPVREG